MFGLISVNIQHRTKDVTYSCQHIRPHFSSSFLLLSGQTSKPFRRAVMPLSVRVVATARRGLDHRLVANHVGQTTWVTCKTQIMDRFESSLAAVCWRLLLMPSRKTRQGCPLRRCTKTALSTVSSGLDSSLRQVFPTESGARWELLPNKIALLHTRRLWKAHNIMCSQGHVGPGR